MAVDRNEFKRVWCNGLQVTKKEAVLEMQAYHGA